MRKIMPALVVAIVLLSPVSVMAEGTIKIGLIEPLSGSVAYNGKSAVQGAKLAVSERNRNGGVNGKKVDLAIQDGQCMPSSSVNAAQRLILEEGVVSLIGAFCSSATVAVMPVAKQYETPLLSGVSSSASLTKKGNPYFFRSSGTDALLAKAFAEVIANKLDLKKVAYIGVNDDWGRGGVKAFSGDLEALGVQTVMVEYFKHGTTNFYTLLTKLRSTDADGVFIAAETQDASVLIRQLEQFGINIDVFGVGAWINSDFLTLTGAAANGIYAAVPYVSSLPSKRNQQYVDAYKDKYGELPGKYATQLYNALNIMMDAIEQADSTDAQAILGGLRQTEYHGPNGDFQFTDNGQAYGFKVVLAQIRDGKPVVVGTSKITPIKDEPTKEK